MPGVCPRCGLPLEVCTCKAIEIEAARIKVYLTKRRFGKSVTIIEGIDANSGKEIVKKLKRKLACGGTWKNGNIELQGDHRARVKELLKSFGYEEEQIEVIGV